MSRGVFIRRVVYSLIATLALTASAIAQEQPVLNVSNVEEFYAAVNNPVNARRDCRPGVRDLHIDGG